MGIEFFQTQMGHKFYESDVPRIAKALERIADKLDVKEPDKTKEDRITWNNAINGLRGNLYSSDRVPESFPRFDISGDDEILCKTEADADCIADFLKALGVSDPIHTSEIEEGDPVYKWEVYPD